MTAIIRCDKKYVTVLCERGHLLEAHKLDKWFAGSSLEAHLSFRQDGDIFDRMAEQCGGSGH